MFARSTDGVSFGTNGATLSEIRSPMMDSLINTKYESLTMARAAAGFPERRPDEAVYDTPAELEQYPHRESMNLTDNDYHDIVDSPEEVNNDLYCGRYISMQPASDVSQSGSQTEREGEVRVEIADMSRRTLGVYDVPRELDHHRLVGLQ